MALTQVSRSPFASPDQPSLADVIDGARAASNLPKITCQNWVWAVRTIARVAGKELAAIPAHPDFLRRLLAGAAPASLGLSPGAWNNAKSLAGKAMEWAGLTNIPGHYMAPYTPEWQRLWSMLPVNTALAVQLSRLFHYCSANGIRPIMCRASGFFARTYPRISLYSVILPFFAPPTAVSISTVAFMV